jgi:hypothetical protein
MEYEESEGSWSSQLNSMGSQRGSQVVLAYVGVGVIITIVIVVIPSRTGRSFLPQTRIVVSELSYLILRCC